MHCATLPRMTQPKEAKTSFTVYLDPVDIRRLGVAAQLLQRTRSNVACLALVEYLNNLDITDPAPPLDGAAGKARGGTDAGAKTVPGRGRRR